MASSEPQFVRQHLSGMAKSEAAGLELLGPCPPHLGEAWIDIPLPHNQTNPTKVVWPKSSDESKPLRCPLVIYFHGGGYSSGSPDLVLAPARGFATLLSCVVACPSINQLPTQPFPGPVRAAWEACAWMSDVRNLNEGVLNSSGVSVDLGRGFVVGGLSSGGAAAAVIGSIPDAMSAGLKEFAGLTPLQSPVTGIFTGIPFLVSEAMLPSEYRGMFKSRDMEMEGKAAFEELHNYLEAQLDVHSPWFSPINLDSSKVGTFQRHPTKVFVYGGEVDPFRDDAIIYEKWLSKLAGVQSRTTILKGEGHMGWVSLPWPACHSRMMKEVTLDGMAWLLDLEWDKNLKDIPF